MEIFMTAIGVIAVVYAVVVAVLMLIDDNDTEEGYEDYKNGK